MSSSTSVPAGVAGLHPAMGLPVEDLRAVLTAAGRAPSVHNTQPWLFRVSGDHIEVRSDPTRQLPQADPDGRELRICCGAAAFNLALALRLRGVQPQVAIRPAAHPEAEAVVRSTGGDEPSLDDWLLGHAISTWRTHRQPFLDAPVPAVHRTALCDAAGQENAGLLLIEDPAQRQQMIDIITAAHRDQQASAPYRAEFGAWTGGSAPRPDGVPVTASGPIPEPQDLLPFRDFGQSRAVRRADGSEFESAPVLAILVSAADGPAAQVRAGLALQRVLLTATSLGLGVSFFSQPIEVPARRAQLQELVGGRTPHAVLRLGLRSPQSPTVRRRIEDLLI